MSLDDRTTLLELADAVMRRARARGADVAEAIVRSGRELSTKVRLGKIEQLEEAGSRSAGLRVLCGGRTATTTSSDLSPEGLERLVDDALELAQLSEVDPFAGPPEPSLLATDTPELELFDEAAAELDAPTALALARRGEEAARAADPRISNSEGATFSRHRGTSALVTSGGFSGAYRSTSFSLVVSPVADDEGGKKRRGAYWDSNRHFAALDTPEAIGAEAARRTLAKLGARRVPTGEYPVVFSREAASALLGLISSCVTGGAVYRRASYLADRRGTSVASSLVNIVDDPLVLRGPGSRPWDGEGLPSRRTPIVRAGVLDHFLLDSYGARKLGLASTGSAARAGGGGISASPTNLWLEPGEASAEALVADLDGGLHVTGMMGFGFNAVTGDFSRGAEGAWIERGERVHAVAEVTVSVPFDALWSQVEAIANDLDRRSRTSSPAFRVGKVTLGGA